MGWQPPNVAGKTFPGRAFTIEAAAVERFARVLGSDPTLGVPPTYAAVYALGATVPDLLTDEEAQVDFAHLVHGEQEFAWTRAPRLGETLTATGTVVEDSARRGMRFLTYETVCRDGEGAEVCRSRMLSIIRSPA